MAEGACNPLADPTESNKRENHVGAMLDFVTKARYTLFLFSPFHARAFIVFDLVLGPKKMATNCFVKRQENTDL